ncbi:MAG TPA: GNAT family N-acetyltransferase [Nitrospiraceae bacterium]|nr:GNAT family N-acetyltransferase [Nitrospiraceae bacterium]
MQVLGHMNVRHAGPDDVVKIALFSAAMALETEGRRLDLDRLHLGTIALIETPARGFFIVAEQEQGDRRQLLGQLMVTYEWSDWRNGAFWWIQSVYVDASWRRRGVFRLMHQAVMREARMRTDVCGVRLYVDKDNPIAQTTYERLGLIRSTYQIYESDFVLPPKTSKECS